MKDIFFKVLLCGCIFVSGACSMANTLSSVEVSNLGNNGKIVLNTDKTKIQKNIISADEIILNLKNTTVSDNIKTVCDNLSSNTDVSVVQDGNNTFINISGENVADFDLLFQDGSLIPLSSVKNDFGFCSFALLALVAVACIAKVSGSFCRKSQDNLRNVKIENMVRQQIVEKRELKTLRSRTKVCNNSVIHGMPVLNFSVVSKMNKVSLPSSFRNTDEYLDYNQLKKVVNA